MSAIRPLAATAETVTLSRADWERVVEAMEDAEDRASLRAWDALVAELGEAGALAEGLPAEALDRMIAGEGPVRVWREHRGLTARALAEASGVSVAYLSEIETRKKPGSARALAALARALRVAVEDLLVEERRPSRG